MNQKPLKFAVIGSGYRAKFYARVAKRYPSLFQLQMIVCRSEQKARSIEEELACRAVYDVKECEKAHPDLIVIAVNKASISESVQEWVNKGYPVLAETPVASEAGVMKQLWKMQQRQNARIFVAEQYHRYPSLMPGLEAIRRGLLGEPQTAYLSLAHDYHGASLIRRMLRTGIEDFSLFGLRVKHPVVETDSRYGAITDGRIAEKARDQIIFQFASGKTAIYDFSGLQYHSFLRSRHLTVRGSLGEWNDTELRYIDTQNLVHHKYLSPAVPEKYSALMQAAHADEALFYDTFSSTGELPHKLPENGAYTAQELIMDNAQDEFAIASLLFDIQSSLQDKSIVYPLQEALEDAHIWSKIEEAVKTPGKLIHSEEREWQNA